LILIIIINTCLKKYIVLLFIIVDNNDYMITVISLLYYFINVQTFFVGLFFLMKFHIHGIIFIRIIDEHIGKIKI